jgi:glycine oxidase
VQRAKIAIVGAGIAGLCTAYWLVKQGRVAPTDILILEAKTAGSGATGAAAGMLAPAHELDPAEPELLPLGIASWALYPQLEADLGDIGLLRHGTLEVALSRDDIPLLQRHYRFQQQYGLEVEWLEGAALQSKEPLLASTVPAAIWAPNDWQVDNRLLVVRLLVWLQAQGVGYHDQLGTILKWQTQSDSITLEYAAAIFEAEKILFATGIQAVPSQPLAVRPVKGQMLSLAPDAGFPLKHTIRIRSKALGNGYIVPKADRLVLGSTSEEMGLDAHLTAGGVLDILRRAYAVLPGLYDLPILETWVGHRPASPSNLPELVKLPESPAWFLNGLYRHGILLGPLMGQRAAAELVKN